MAKKKSEAKADAAKPSKLGAVAKAIGSAMSSPKSAEKSPKASAANAAPVSNDTPTVAPTADASQQRDAGMGARATNQVAQVSATASSQSEKLAYEFGRRYQFLNDPDPDIRQGAMKSILKFFHKNTGITARDIQQIAKDLAPSPRPIGAVALATSKKGKGKDVQRKQKKSKNDPRIAALRKEFKGKDQGPESEYASRVRALRKEAKVGL